MKIIPAIDLIDGQVVRLVKGDPDKKTVYSNNPLEIAKKWQNAGADMLHIVDLDATLGRGSNLEIIKKIVKEVKTPVQIAGGLRETSLITEVANIANRVVLGTIAFQNEDLLEQLLETLGPEKIVISADHIDGKIVVKGWQESTAKLLIDSMKKFLQTG
ncbi:MAG: HisA/HisF-related TIM barrel protein, partial [Nitrosopumilaceae archaeon]